MTSMLWKVFVMSLLGAASVSTAAEIDAMCAGGGTTPQAGIDACNQLLAADAHTKYQLARILFNRGLWKERAGDHDGAIEDFTSAIGADRKKWDAFDARARVRARKRDFLRALQDHDEAIRLNPGSPVVRLNRGVTWGWKGDRQRALADYSAAIRLDPLNAEVFLFRGRSWKSLGDWTRALADFDEAIRLRPRWTDAYVTRGKTWLAQRDFDRALADFSEALRLDPKKAEALIFRAETSRMKGDLNQALVDVEASLRIHPEAMGYFVRAGVWLARNDLDQAISDFTEAIRLDAGSTIRAAVYHDRAIARSRKGDREGEMADLNEAIRLAPDFATAYRTRALGWRERGDLERAIADLDAAIRLTPDSALIYLDRGVTRAKQDDRDGAKADFEEAIRIRPNDASWLNEVAWLLASSPTAAVRDGKRAVALAQRACELSGWKQWRYLDTLAAAYAENGNFEDAIRWQEAAAKSADNAGTKSNALRARLTLYRAGQPYRAVH